MGPHHVVVLHVFDEDTTQMPLIDQNEVVEALAPQRPDHPLRDGVRVGRADRRQDGRDADAGGARMPESTTARGLLPAA